MTRREIITLLQSLGLAVWSEHVNLIACVTDELEGHPCRLKITSGAIHLEDVSDRLPILVSTFPRTRENLIDVVLRYWDRL